MIATNEFLTNLINNCISKSLQREKCLSQGQFIYNYMYNTLGHLEPTVETLGRDDVDPFYNDDKIYDFLEAIKEEMLDKEYN